ncbi:MAG: prepilin-type N-terminal cleavage/methylation domain-containing protein [Anaerococcus hydrogenalis]|uniref:prepilin-type N-terminal cleavage/methylation domain-containing protein n=1 Tax=Anaerococcus hydrogenalis TaxID=33029 RepID=UPI0029045F21|nr:prepilin-type N-terminal cleavage/methylation domain-containing protein [Anaerococcus hydrogenalis]MDU2583106.1 prepilin-type N-terminal cleavage/methylation domain-containing protein [Anaerococcus hydrogenalis]
MRKKGFTLIELICVLAISSILILLINNIVKTNLNISKKTYEEELSYKNSTNCLLYIENIIRNSDDVIDIKDENNFKLQITSDDHISTYRFYQDKDVLYVYINNINSESDSERKIPIGFCKSSRISYDKKEDSFTIAIEFYEKNKKSTYRTYIRRL